MATWQLLFDDNFDRANSSTGAANSITGVQNNWIDVQGGVYNINAIKLKVNAPATTGFATSQLLRPTVENLLDVQYIIDYDVPTNVAAATSQYFVFHRQDANNYYIVRFQNTYQGSTTSAVVIYKYIAGVLTSLAVGGNFSITAGHTYQLQVQSTTNATPATTIVATLIDTTSSSTVSTATVTNDLAVGIQVAGQHGISSGMNATYVQNITRIRAYYNNPTGMTTASQYISTGITRTVTFTGSGTSWTGGTTFTLTNAAAAASISSQTNNSATSQDVSIINGTTVGSLLMQDGAGAKWVIFVITQGLQVSPRIVADNNSSQSIALTGISTSWTAGTPGTPTFTLAMSGGASGASIVSQTIADSFDATIIINTGTTGGIVTITDPSTGKTADIAVTDTKSVTDPGIFFSPGNWFSDGAGTVNSNGILSGSTLAESLCPGAYFAFTWTGTDLTVDFNTSTSSFGTVRYSIDNGAPTDLQLSAATSYILATQLSSGTHTCILYYVIAGAGTGWTSPTSYIQLTGIVVNGALSAYTPLRPYRAIIYGDSYQQGTMGQVTGISNFQDSTQTIAYSLAQGLNAEVGVVGAAGGGMCVTSTSGVVPGNTPGNDAQTSWNKFLGGAYRVYTSGTPALGGTFTPQPDFVISIWGTNDDTTANATVQAAYYGWLVGVRAAAPNATILLLIPPNGSASTGITAGFNQYQLATPDSKAKLINIGVIPGLVRNGPTSLQSADGLHPRVSWNSYIANKYMHAIQSALLPRVSSILAFGKGKPDLVAVSASGKSGIRIT